MNVIKLWFNLSLSKKIMIMLLLGVIVGLAAGPKATALQPIGDLFIRLLKMLIVPLVFFTLASGVTKMDSPKSLRRVGGFIVTYYVLTALFAAIAGTVVALILRPGRGVQGILGSAGDIKAAKFSVIESLLNWVPTNPVEAMASTNMLQIIFFALLLGVVLLLLGKKASLITDFINQGSDVAIRITGVVMETAPYGIFALVAVLVGTLGQKMMFAVGKFVVADYIAILFMLIVVYPVLLKVLGRLPVLKFYKRIAPAMIVAATTTSSAATLPVEMDIARDKIGIPEKIYGFTLPLGNTANMDGLAAALGVISVFALDIFQKPINIATIFMIIYLGLVLSIGCAGVKGAGIVMSAVLFEALDVPLTLVPVLAAIWPIIDIPHTTANVTGDMVGTTICAERRNELNWDIFNGETTNYQPKEAMEGKER